MLAACHTVGMVDGQLVGPELEVRMLEASGFRFAGSGGARSFVSPSGARVDVVRALEFDHDRMTSGALVRTGGKAVLMVKGSYERVGTLCPVPQEYKAVTTQAASDNYYILGVAYREVTEAEVEKLAHAPRAEVEKDLKFLGLLLFRNQLKPDSASAIAALRAGNIRTVMCTGSNSEGRKFAGSCIFSYILPLPCLAREKTYINRIKMANNLPTHVLFRSDTSETSVFRCSNALIMQSQSQPLRHTSMF